MSEQSNFEQSTASADAGTASADDNFSVFMQSLEDSLQRGAAFAKENPVVTAVGVASVAALLVIVSKRALTPETSYARLERQLRSAANEAPTAFSNSLDSISNSISRALTADPKTVQMIQDTVAQLVDGARTRIEPYLPDTLAKR